ncbi:MAG: hypothetical protein M3Y68_08565 [Chloroflexota bacterium]|nr:hypothetical protein [Chloroflexota bacterium]
MGTLYRYLIVFIVLAQLVTACSAQSARAKPAISQAHQYRQLLGKLVTETAVSDLLAASNCVRAAPFEVCKEAGLALWMDASGIVQNIYLYLHNGDGFTSYKGDLPFGLKFYDTMGAVEYKLNRQGIGKEGRPDEAAVPDHFHYWAFYGEASMTIIYNTPFADEDATIYAIVLNG